MTTFPVSVVPVLLAVRHASKSYNGVPALIDAALELRSGEVHALMGENGAGKSTLIKLLAGVLSADRIEVEVGGQPATLNSPQSAYDHGLRFIHQELNVVPQLSVAENVFLGQRYPSWLGMVVRWRALNRRARDVLASLGVHHIASGERMARLSPGDQMLVSIARAFAGDDQNGAGEQALVYVMDEPTAALTGHEVDLLFEVIERLKRQGSAILYVSHRMEEIFRIADRITVMRDGRVVGTRAAAETSPAELIRLMTGRSLQQVYPPRATPMGERLRLEVRNLRSHAVRAHAFALREGEIVGVAGLNGAGRTELLRALIGADRRLSGEIALDGQTVSGLSPVSAWRNGVAYVPEERRSQGLVLSRSVADNITLPGLAWLSRGGVLVDRGLEQRTSRTVGETVRLKMIGPEQTVRELSGGNQQKTVFARALTRLTRLLLLDEPTRGVDVGAKVDLYQLIRELSAQGTAVLMVSSDLPELLGMTDRILIMRDGILAVAVPTAGLTEESLLALCYGETAHERPANGGR